MALSAEEEVTSRDQPFPEPNTGTQITLRKTFRKALEKSIFLAMTKLLEQAVETVRGLPAEMQDDLARILLQLAGKDLPVLPLGAKEEASLEESLAQAERGEFATDEQVRAIWAKHGL
jgi:hypothetical protein